MNAILDKLSTLTENKTEKPDGETEEDSDKEPEDDKDETDKTESA